MYIYIYIFLFPFLFSFFFFFYLVSISFLLYLTFTICIFCFASFLTLYFPSCFTSFTARFQNSSALLNLNSQPQESKLSLHTFIPFTFRISSIPSCPRFRSSLLPLSALSLRSFSFLFFLLYGGES